MRIANLMFSRGLGGIEQAFLDYGEGLALAGAEVTAFTHPKAAVNPAVGAIGLSHLSLSNMGQWDPCAPPKLATMLRTVRADIVIAHGNRAIVLAKKAVGGRMPIVAVAHNYRFQHLDGVNAIFAITEHMRQAIYTMEGYAGTPVYVISNMVRIRGNFVRGGRKTPPLVGSLGRMVQKKGFDTFLHALAELQTRGVVFQAVLGGGGEEEKTLKRTARRLGLYDVLEFPGWVDNAQALLESMDIFCLPSLHEPFGIVLLEAMAAKLPVVSTDTEGPSEIIASPQQGMLVPKDDPIALADALQALLADEGMARNMAAEGFRRVREQYNMERICTQMTGLLEQAREAFVPVETEVA